MEVAGHRIPEALAELVLGGRWAGDLGKGAASKVSPDDNQLELCEPFSLEIEAKENPEFWCEELSNYGEIRYSDCVVIADFGPGSDSVVILNYSSNEQPIIQYLKWTGNGENTTHSWEMVANDICVFLEKIGMA